MHLYFDEIPPLGRDLSWTLAAVDRDAGIELATPLTAFCRVWPAGAHRVEIEGRLQGKVRLCCDRCLESYLLAVELPYRLTAVVEGADTVEQGGDDREIGPEEGDILELAAPCLDLDELARQQLLLALPEKRLCRTDCAGLCPHCGTNRNQSPCGCAQGAVDSPFAVLAKLTGKG